MRPSETHAIRIDAVDTARGRGQIGIAFAPGKYVRHATGGPWEISSSDATLAITTAQAIVFEAAHIASSAPSGDQVGISDTAAHLQALTAAQITGLSAIGATSVVSNNGAVMRCARRGPLRSVDEHHQSIGYAGLRPRRRARCRGNRGSRRIGFGKGPEARARPLID